MRAKASGMDGVTLEAGGPVYLRLEFPEKTGQVEAVFSTRIGGFSPPPYDTLNLGYGGDKPGNVLKNRKALLSALGYMPDRVVVVSQVHGREVAVLDHHAAAEGARDFRCLGQADAIITDQVGFVLMTLYADCVPVYLYDPVKHVAGLAHAGWRGTVAGTPAACVEKMAGTFGSQPRDLVATIGPSIGPCCYEVGPEVVLALEEAFPRSAVTIRNGGRTMADLWTANAAGLVQVGLATGRIHVTGLCTACRRDLFFSYRAEGGKTGRMGACIALRPRA